MAQSPVFLRRGMLYVPGSSQKMLAKSRALAVDSVIYDLEDSVAPDAKATARELVTKCIAHESMSATAPGRGPREVSVRINAVETGLALQDLMHVRTRDNLDTIVVPKVHSPADLHFVADVIRHFAPGRVPAAGPSGSSPAPGGTYRPLHILGLIESARGLANLHEICRAGRPIGLTGLGFAAEDFASDLSLSRLPDRRELLFARSAIVTACRAHDVPTAIDMVSVGFRGAAGGSSSELEVESREGRALGFTGKQAIHPSQVEVIQPAFAPSESEVEWAMRVEVRDAKARRDGKGAWSLDGKMVDTPVVKRAMALLEKAALCGIDVEGYRQKCKD
ncbi:Citrate lyase beta [Pleurostoma richardsiae]|uniref:Citrate lyase beta n=1 Tax=Pleurostoma richardsiae TaxID=41990 RepID=A0AA38RNJ0_9PEZI|nr:Citrate lyase beta [Pleurostoma richardsiae]